MDKLESLLFLKNADINTPDFFYILPEKIDTYAIPEEFQNKLVSIRSSPVYSMPGILDTKLNVYCTSENILNFYDEQLTLFNSKLAKLYRRKRNLPETPPNIIVQLMVDGKKGGSGVYLTHVGVSNSDVNEYKKGISGENIVQNLINSIDFDELTEDKLIEIKSISEEIVKVLKTPIEIEYTIEDDILYILQVRPIEINDVLKKTAILQYFKQTGIINDSEFSNFLDATWNGITNIQIIDPEKKPINVAIPVVPGIVNGILYKDIGVFNDINNEILTDIDNYSGIITKRGSLTSHISIICRNLNKPYIIFPDIDILPDNIIFDGDTGNIYDGNSNIFINVTKQDFICVL